MKFVYIAGPYRAFDMDGVKANIENARRTAVELLKALHQKPVAETPVGHCFASGDENKSILERTYPNSPYPIVPHMGTALFDYEPGIEEIGDKFWLAGTMEQLLTCQFVLLTSPDAPHKSHGTRNEVIAANRNNIPVFEDVAAFIYYLTNDEYGSQVDSRVQEIALNQEENHVGRVLHVFGAPNNEKPRTPQQIP